MTQIAAPLGVLAVAGAVSLALGEGAARRAVMLTAAIISAGWIVARLASLTGEITGLASGEGMSEYVTPLIKGVGISWATAITALALGEIGENGAAHAAELVGAAELCVIAIPLAVKLVSLALGLV